MKVAIFGMGHVGLVTAAMLAEGGHAVAGVDVDRERLESLRLGRLPFNEPELAEIVCAQMAAGRLSFTADGVTAASLCDAALVCVGTPLGDAGAVDLRAVYDVLAVIAQGIIASDEEIVLVIRSTTPPLALDALRAAVERQIPGCYCGFCVNPEFLREGSAVEDFRHPPLVLIGQDNAIAGDTVAALYAHLAVEITRTDCRTAMLVKYVSNAWHALKVTFANEIGDVAREVGVDGQELMHIFAQDTTLNISPAYLRPGAPYGGSCLPKDLTALVGMSSGKQYLLRAIEASNTLQVLNIWGQVNDVRHVGMIGLSFKRGTDDLRGSPWTQIVDWLICHGNMVRVYDPDVARSVAGEYGRYLRDSFDELEEWAEVLIIGKPELLPPDARLPERVIYGDGR